MTQIYGLLAEFTSPTELVESARRVRDAGYRRIDAYSPFPIHELPDALGHPRTRLPLVVLIGGLIGFFGGYLFQYWTAVHAYPLNIGGRPLHSWPAFIPVTFETTVLCASLAAVLGMLGRNGLPRPHHPLFNVTRFSQATRDRFFLCIESADPKFEREETWKLLNGLGAVEVAEVPY